MSDCQTCGSRPSSCKLCPGCDSMLGRYQYEHKRMEAENTKLRSALEVAREAREALESIAATDMEFPADIEKWSEDELREVVFNDTAIARKPDPRLARIAELETELEALKKEISK